MKVMPFGWAAKPLSPPLSASAWTSLPPALTWTWPSPAFVPAVRQPDTSTAAPTALTPLIAVIRTHVLSAERLHGDDTTVPVLARGKTITGRLWVWAFAVLW